MRAATTRPQTRPSVPRYSPGPHVYPRQQSAEEDRRYMAKVRHVVDLLDDEHEHNSREPEVSYTKVVEFEQPKAQTCFATLTQPV